MTISPRTLLQMALNALENSYLSDEHRNYELQAKAIAALREALNAPEPSVDDMPGMWEPSDTFGGEADSAAPPAAPAPAQPANPWRDVIDNELVSLHLDTADSFPDARSALQAVIDWHVKIALDPAVSSDAQALIDRGPAQPEVPLTDEQIINLRVQTKGDYKPWSESIAFARAIERAHGIAASPEVPK